MATTTYRSLLRHHSQLSQIPRSSFFTRFNSTSATHESSHDYLSPCDYVGSWKKPSCPKEAEALLAHLRRDYAKKVKAMRKEYIHEMELQRIEKQRKDEAKKEALRLANEERKRFKAAAAEARAAERKVAMEEFRQTLIKERAEKLENWRMKEKKHAGKVKEEKELLRKKSSLWVSEAELEKKIMEAIVDSTSL